MAESISSSNSSNPAKFSRGLQYFFQRSYGQNILQQLVRNNPSDFKELTSTLSSLSASKSVLQSFTATY